MSTYTATEELLLTRIRAYNSGGTFDEANSSRGKFRVLNNPGVTQAAVLMQAGRSEMADSFGGGRGAMGKRQQRHRIGIVLFQARLNSDDGDTYEALTTLTDALVAYLDTYQRLGDPTKRVEILEVSEPRVRRDTAWLFQTVLVEALTETAPVVVEYAR
jgi:hypothetical protein